MEMNPPYFRAFPRFKRSAPIKVPKTPEIKAEGAANFGAKIKEKRAEKIGGTKAGRATPLPGIVLAKNLEIIIIKTVAIKIGPISKPDFQPRKRK